MHKSMSLKYEPSSEPLHISFHFMADLRVETQEVPVRPDGEDSSSDVVSCPKPCTLNSSSYEPGTPVRALNPKPEPLNPEH